MRNGQLKPGYNIQVGSCNGFVVNWSTHQNRNDNGTLIPHYEDIKDFLENYQIVQEQTVDMEMKKITNI